MEVDDQEWEGEDDIYQLENVSRETLKNTQYWMMKARNGKGEQQKLMRQKLEAGWP